MNIRKLSLFSLILLISFANLGTLQSQEKPWWNPFASDSTPSTTMDSGPVHDSTLFSGGGSSSMFKFPDWEAPSWFKNSKPKSKKSPSTLSRMGRTTKRWWGNTIDFINPFDSPDAKFTQGYQPQYATPKSKSGSGMFGWMMREETVESPATVNDFLRQPKPRF